MNHRLPRKVNLGRSYWIRVTLAGKKQLADIMDDDVCEVDALWIESLGEGLGYAGTIYIYSGLSHQRKWEAYWHEIIHAVNDISAYDRDHPLIT